MEGRLSHDVVVGDKRSRSVKSASREVNRIKRPQGRGGDAFGDDRARFVENPACDRMKGKSAASLPKCTKVMPSAFASSRVQLSLAALALQNGTALRQGEL